MSLTSLVLKMAAPLPKVEQFQRYLFVGPHPDDIEIGAGATAAKLVEMGKQVCFLICTDGRFGTVHTPKEMTTEELVEIRKRESIESAAKLGVTDVRFLGLSDGGFYEEKELLRGIANVVGEFQPDMVFAPDPCVISECHRDHLNVGNAAKQIACFGPYEGIMEGYGAKGAPVQAVAFYMTAKPNRYVKIKGQFKKQIDAVFTSHLSQFPEGCADGEAIKMYLNVRSRDFGLRSLKGRAEGFRVLDGLHMHCLPEAGER